MPFYGLYNLNNFINILGIRISIIIHHNSKKIDHPLALKYETILNSLCNMVSKRKGKPGNPRGDKDFGLERIILGQDNKEDVFNAIRNIGIENPKKTMVRLEDIEKELEEQTQHYNKYILKVIHNRAHYTEEDIVKAFEKEKLITISRHTIQNCIKRDHRIKKQGWHFYIDNEARFEKRYLNPEEFGLIMFEKFDQEMCNKKSIENYNKYHAHGKKLEQRESLRMQMKGMVETFGVFLVYSFIEAAKPFKDLSLDVAERQDLGHYWIKNCIPLYDMFTSFKGFDPNAKADETKPDNEMDDESIQNVTSILEECYPDMMRILRKSFYDEIGYTSVSKKGNSYQSGFGLGRKVDHFVSGKSFHKVIPPFKEEE